METNSVVAMPLDELIRIWGKPPDLVQWSCSICYPYDVMSPVEGLDRAEVAAQLHLIEVHRATVNGGTP